MQNMSGKSTFGLDANLVALLCYVNVCLPIGLVMSIATIVTEKNNKLPRFHAFQSLILSVLLIIFCIGIWIAIIVGALIDAVIMGAIGLPIPIVTGLSGLIFGVLSLAVFIGIIIAAIKAYQGQIFKFPIVGNLADKFSG